MAKWGLCAGILFLVPSARGQASTNPSTAPVAGEVMDQTGAVLPFGRVDNDTNSIVSYPGSDNDLSGEWARANFDRRHGFLLLGTIYPAHVVDLGVGSTLNSAGPRTTMVGSDVHNNSRGRGRPVGVQRNSLEDAGLAQVDFPLSRQPAACGVRAIRPASPAD